MGKRKKVIISVIIAIFVIFFGFGIFVKLYLSGEKLKAFVVPRIEEAIGRKVLLKDIALSVFKGIVVSDLKVMNIDGNGVFIKADKFILAYEPFALIRKRFVISRIEIVSPSVDIKRYANGIYNITEGKPKEKPKEPDRQDTSPRPTKKDLPVSVVADKVLIKSAKITFVDDKKEFPKTSLIFDADIRCSLGNNLSAVLERGNIKLKELKSTINRLNINASGVIDVDMKHIKPKLQLTVGKNTFYVDGIISDYLGLPSAQINVNAREMNINELISAAETGKTQGAKRTEKVDTLKKKHMKIDGKKNDAPQKGVERFQASGQIKVDSATYERYIVKNFRTTYRYNDGKINIEPFIFSFSGGDAVKAEGNVNGVMYFNYGDASVIKKGLVCNARMQLGKVSINKSKTFDTIALLTGVDELKTPGFDNGTFSFDAKKEIINVNGFMKSDLMIFSPKGTVGFDKRLNINAELRLTPQLSARLSRRIPGISLLKGDDGWTTLPFLISGTTENPSIGLDQKVLGGRLKDSTKDILQNLIGSQKTDKKNVPERSGSRGLFDKLLGR